MRLVALLLGWTVAFAPAAQGTCRRDQGPARPEACAKACCAGGARACRCCGHAAPDGRRTAAVCACAKEAPKLVPPPVSDVPFPLGLPLGPVLEKPLAIGPQAAHATGSRPTSLPPGFLAPLLI